MKKLMIGLVLGMMFAVSSGWAGENEAESMKNAVTQTNVKVLGDAPAAAQGILYEATDQTVGFAAANAVYGQQQSNVTFQAATTMGVSEAGNQTGSGGEF